MNQIYLHFTPEGIKLIEGDKMPPEQVQTNAWNGKDYRENAFNNSQKFNYEAALQRAKEQAVTVANKKEYQLRQMILMLPGVNEVANDTIYGPFSLRYEIQSKCELWCSDCKAFDWSTCKDKQVAILYDDAEKEESQEDIFNNLFCRYFDLTMGEGKSAHTAVQELKEKFTITRK